MFRARFVAPFPVAIALSTILLSATPASAHATGRWTLSLGAGPVDRFSYRTYSFGFGHYSEYLGFSGFLVAGAAYRLSDHVSLRADAGYLGYQEEMAPGVTTSTSGIFGMWPTGSSLTAQMPFVSAGVRLDAPGVAATRPRLYFEALPTLWVTRWRERLEYGPYIDYAGNQHPGSLRQDSFTALEPGFSAGVGLIGPLVGRTKLDVGFRYLFSVGAGERELGEVSSGGFGGLRQFALVLGLRRSI